MDFEIAPGHIFQQGRLNVFIAPVDRFVSFFNESLNFQRYMTLYVSGNFSRVLSGIDRTATRFEVRRAFTSHQLLTILQENYHTIVIFEYDPMLFEGDARMRDIIAKALVEASHSGIVILYAPKTDWILRQVLKGVNRLFLYGESVEFFPEYYLRETERKRVPGRFCRQNTLPV